MNKIIKIGTRKSKLALWQANYVANLLKNADFIPELVPIDTKGDKIQKVPLSKIGSKGVFTEELEMALKKKQIHIAVHSAKDLPATLSKEFSILAFTKRESAEDVILSHQSINLNNPSLVLATSSTRRIAFFKHFYPNISIINIRGNLQTRINKLEKRVADGLVLAYAGIRRMGYQSLIKHHLDKNKFVPSVGQGALAIEIHSTLDDEIAKQIKVFVNDSLTEKILLAERSFLKTMKGGCSIPVFGYAEEMPDGKLSMTGGIATLDGKKIVRHTMKSEMDPQELGKKLAEKILESGGKSILESIFDKK